MQMGKATADNKVAKSKVKRILVRKAESQAGSKLMPRTQK